MVRGFDPRPRRAFPRVEVSGRDRCHFFKRPILPNRDPLPVFRSDPVCGDENAQGQIDRRAYHQTNRGKRIQLSSSEWAKDESAFAFCSAGKGETMPSSTDSATSQLQDGTKSLFQRSKMTQTRLRESFAQTEPCSLDHRHLTTDGIDTQECQEQMGLEDLSFGHGLPVTTPMELSTAENLLRNHISLASATDFMARQHLLENREKIKWQARTHQNRKTKEARTEYLAKLLDELFQASEDLLEQKLEDLNQDQQAKERANFSAMVRYHQRHISALECKALKKTSRLRFGSVSAQPFPHDQLDREGNDDEQFGPKRSVQNSSAVHRGSTLVPDAKMLKRGEADGDLGETLMSLESIQGHIEQDLERRFASILSIGIHARTDSTSGETKARPSGSPIYLKRSERYNHLLDSAYSEIQSAKLDRQRQDNPNLPNRHILNQSERIFIMEMLRHKHRSMVAKSSARFKHQIGNQQRRSLPPSNNKPPIEDSSNNPTTLSTLPFDPTDGTGQKDEEKQVGSSHDRSMFGFDSRTKRMRLADRKYKRSNSIGPDGGNETKNGISPKSLSAQHDGRLSKFVRNHVRENIGLASSDSESSSMELVSFVPKTFQEDSSNMSRVPKKALNSQLEDLITIVLSKSICELDLEQSNNFDNEEQLNCE